MQSPTLSLPQMRTCPTATAGGAHDPSPDHPQRESAQPLPLTPKGDESVCKVAVGKHHFALVDEADFDLVSQFTWHAQQERPTSSFYAKRRFKDEDGVWRSGYMHRMILRLTDTAIQADHVNHDGLDNRRANLRPVTNQENQFNCRSRVGISGFKGVIKASTGSAWRASITFNNKRYHLGSFHDPEDAALAYDAKARELFGEHAYLNFPEEVTA